MGDIGTAQAHYEVLPMHADSVEAATVEPALEPALKPVAEPAVMGESVEPESVEAR